jgi:NTE family protein
MKLGLVLGAGGVVGMSYHAGVLHALHQEGGLDPRTADLVVGTSAGSAVGALLRSGVSAQDLWDLVHSEQDQPAAAFERKPGGPLRQARRLVGSTYVATRSVIKTPVPRIPGVIARRFPAGVFGNAELKQRLAEVLPDEWPEEPLWLVAVDVHTGRRVVLRKSGTTGATLHEAVLASCAIPGIYPPVKVKQRLLVDGGAHSSTHLDLAAEWGCDAIIGSVPMGYDPADAPTGMSRMIRRTPTLSVAREMKAARARGASVFLLRPCAAEVRTHGRDMMRPADVAAVARAAYECTARELDTPRFRRILDRSARSTAA